jgi:hypothetical protein
MNNNSSNLNIKHASRWLSGHGHPSPGELEKLGNTNSFAALEQLRELADAYNVTYDMTHTQRELADRINEAISRGENL